MGGEWEPVPPDALDSFDLMYPAIDEVNAATANPFATLSHTCPSPSCGQQYPSPPKLVLPPLPNPTMPYMTPPTTPNTPSPSYSLTSPVSSASPPNPLGIEDSFKVGDIDRPGYPTFTVNHFNVISPADSAEGDQSIPSSRVSSLAKLSQPRLCSRRYQTHSPGLSSV